MGEKKGTDWGKVAVDGLKFFGAVGVSIAIWNRLANGIPIVAVVIAK